VRLRLDRGTALLRQFGVTSVLCVLVDLSENGCQCRLSLDDLDEDTVRAWRSILTDGRMLTLEMTEPPELRGLVFKEAEVRWVRQPKGGNMEFGMQLGNPEPEQKEILVKAMLSFAAMKLRRGVAASLSSAAAFTGGGVELERAPETAPAAPPSAEPGREMVAMPRVLRLAGPARKRPSRQRVYLPAVFEFRGPDGKEWEFGLHQGRTVDVSEGGMLLEGPGPECCGAKELNKRDARAHVTIRTSDYDVKGVCSVRSAMPSRHIKDGWLYGLQIMEMKDTDRARLRDIYAQAAAARRAPPAVQEG